MMLKTFAVLLSLGTAYSTATNAMAPDKEFESASQRIRAADEALSSYLQRMPVERAAKKEALKQLNEKLAAEDKKLMDATHRNIDALNNLDISAEERDRVILEFAELNKSVMAAKEAFIAEFDKQFGNN